MADSRGTKREKKLDPDYEPSTVEAPRFARKVNIDFVDPEMGGVTSFTLTIPPELKYDGIWGESGGLQPAETGTAERYKAVLTLAFLKETKSGTYYPIHITATGFGIDLISAKKQLVKNMEFVIRARVWDDEGEALDLDNDGTYDVVRAGDAYRYPLYAEYELPEIPWNLSYVPNAQISADNWAEKSNAGLANEIRSGSHTNQFGEVGCPVCGSINEFWKVTGDTGSRFTCMDCFYASGDFYVIIKSRGDKTLSDYGMKIFCEVCDTDVEGLKTRGDFRKHIKSHEKLDSYRTESGGAAHPKTRMTRSEADKTIKGIEKKLNPWVTRMEVCGSYRRGRQDPGDLDIILIPASGISLPELIKDKLKIPESKIHWLGEKKAQVDIGGHNIDFRTSSPDGWGAALLYFTGPSGYNIGMRVRAKKMGFKLNEYGVWDRTSGAYLGGKTEDEVYKLLNKTSKLPELRAEFTLNPPEGDEEYAGWYDPDTDEVTINLAIPNPNENRQKIWDKLFATLDHEYGHKVTWEDVSKKDYSNYLSPGSARAYASEFAAFMIEYEGDFARSRVAAALHPRCFNHIWWNLLHANDLKEYPEKVTISNGGVTEETLNDYYSLLDLDRDQLGYAKRLLNYKIIQEGHPTYKLFLEKLINYTNLQSGVGVGKVEWKKRK